MALTERWRTIQQLAAAERPRLEGTLGGAAGTVHLVHGCLEAHGLDVFPLPSGDPLLGGARAVFDQEFVAYDASLPAPAVAFSLAHELGHKLLHSGGGHCTAADIDEESLAPLLTAPGGVETYSPRQQRELEANAFAAAFLMPAAELRAGFLAGLSYADLAARYGVSETAMLNTLAATLLAPGTAAPASPDDGSSPSRAGEPTGQETGPAAAFPLDESQRAAATVVEGPVLVDAGPGTGKTRTLIERVGFLLREGHSPESILALTFSNRAAGEMRERLRATAPGAADAITVGTFHAFCLQLLQEHGAEAGLPDGVTLIDDVQAAAWLETGLARLGLDHYASLWEPARSLPDILGAISRARDELVDAARYAELAADAARAADAADPPDPKARERAERWAEVARVYAVYEELLERKGALDFGGLLLRTVSLLRARPALLASLQRRYRQILVDEYQDMNRASGVLLGLLAGDGHGLWVVGDLRQAIYRFRGASPANITEFERDFPGGRRMRLAVNYRSDPAIVGLFATLSTAMPLADGATPGWQAHRPAHPAARVWLAQADDAPAEAAGILGEIRRRHAAGRPYGEQVVLCRTHSQAAVVARALEAADVPTLYLGNLFERDEVRDLLAVLALAAEGDGRALLRAVRLTGHSVDRAACTALITYARAQDARFPRALTLAAAAGLDRDAVMACTTLAAAIDAAGVYRSAGDFLARFLFGPVSPLRELLADPRPRAAARVMAIAGLLTLARSFQELSTATVPTADSAGETAEARPLREFLTHARRLYATREVPGRTPAGGDALDAVRVLTVHASKGLEFPVVYVPGLAAGRFPFREMWDACPPPPGLVAGAGEGDHDLEELCLFFVALSRARDELVLSVAGRYGKQAAKPSPFLAHLEPAFTATPPARLQWTAPAETDTPTPLLPLDDGDTTLDIAELEQYMRCPRQYEYTYRLYRESGDAGSGYRQFHHVVQGLVGRLREDQAAGALPSTEAAVLERLRAAWEAEGPGDHPHAELYADAARRVVMNTWQRLRDSPAVTPWQGEIHLPLGGARVRARLDLAQQQPDGSVRVVRTRLGKPRDEDRTAPRLALVQAAARAHLGADVPLTLALEYLDGGETVDVEIKPRYVQERLARLEKAVLGIRAGDFPAAPAAADECLRCPFWIICPT